MNKTSELKKIEPKAEILSLSSGIRNRIRPVTYSPPFETLLEKIEETKSNNLYFYMRVLETASGAEVIVDGRRMIMLGSNNYLGLTVHPKVKRATIRAIEQYGTGASGSRVLSGTHRLHVQLEEKLAELKNAEAAAVFSTGYITNMAAVSILAELGYTLINDDKNHASIIDGCRIQDAEVYFYRHNNMKHLKKVLERPQKDSTKCFIITDGVFSMDGDIADLSSILLLARQHGAKVYLDDAHALGVLGKHGRGTAEHCNVEGQVNLTVGTLSKALGSAGGFIAGSKDFITYLKHASRAFMFGTAMPPSIAATAIAALDVLEKEPEHLERLHQNTKEVRDGLRDMGFEVPLNETPILPVIIGDEMRTYALTRLLHEAGVFVNPVAYPAVKPGKARIRVSTNALLTSQQIGSALTAFKQAGKSLGLI